MNTGRGEGAPPLVDLHTHILPGMDDGAATVADSLGLLRAEAADGVGKIALTPHFHPVMGLGVFLQQRARAFARLQEALAGEDIPVTLRVGAEVRMAPELMELDIGALCLAGTRTVLMELPIHHCPQWALDALYATAEQGYTPLLVHVERFPYVMRKPGTLVLLIEAGACVHINASSFFADERTKKNLLAMIKNGLVHAVASDTHSLDRRPPRLLAAMQMVEQALGAEAVQRLNQQADALFDGQDFKRAKPRGTWFGFRP